MDLTKKLEDKYEKYQPVHGIGRSRSSDALARNHLISSNNLSPNDRLSTDPLLTNQRSRVKDGVFNDESKFKIIRKKPEFESANSRPSNLASALRSEISDLQNRTPRESTTNMNDIKDSNKLDANGPLENEGKSVY